MTTVDVIDLWFNLDLRQHVIDTAKSLSRSKRVQADLVGHVWFHLGETDPQKTWEFYKRFVTLLMEKRYMLIRYKEVKLA